MILGRGVIAGLRVHKPAVIVEVGGAGWEWDDETLALLTEARDVAAGDAWQAHGPALARPESCVLSFETPWDRPVPGRQVLDALQAFPGLDEAVVSPLREVVLLRDRRLDPGALTLRLFPRAEGQDVPHERIRGLVDRCLEWVASLWAQPHHVSVGLEWGVEVDGLRGAGEVVGKIGTYFASPMHAIWPERLGVHALVGVAASGRAVQVALTGNPVLGQLDGYSSLLRQLGVRLAASVALDFARISVEPTGNGVFDSFSFGPDIDLLGEDVIVRRHLDRCVPDAYWWQLVDVSLLDRLDPPVAPTAVIAGRLGEVVFGAPSDWVPRHPWPGQPGWEPGAPIPPALERAREAVKPLLRFRSSFAERRSNGNPSQ